MKLCYDTNAYSAFKNGNTEIKNILENADLTLRLPVSQSGE